MALSERGWLSSLRIRLPCVGRPDQPRRSVEPPRPSPQPSGPATVAAMLRRPRRSGTGAALSRPSRSGNLGLPRWRSRLHRGAEEESDLRHGYEASENAPDPSPSLNGTSSRQACQGSERRPALCSLQMPASTSSLHRDLPGTSLPTCVATVSSSTARGNSFSTSSRAAPHSRSPRVGGSKTGESRSHVGRIGGTYGPFRRAAQVRRDVC